MPRTIRWEPPRTPFTRAHVAPLGVSPAMIRDAHRTGRITRLAHGVFIATDAVADDSGARHLQSALAHQTLRPTAIASHHTAALAWGLDLDDPEASAAAPPTFIQPTGRNSRSQSVGDIRVSVRDLPPGHRVAHPCGLLVTTPARAAVDVVAGLRLPEALITLDSAARLALVEMVGSRRLREHYTNPRSLAAARSALLESAEHAATQFTRRSLCELVALADPRRETALESYSFGQFMLAGLPLPEMQVRISTLAGDVYPDFLWRDQMVIGEADGLIKYDSPGALRAEKVRQEDLEQLGYRVVRWATPEIRSRALVVVARIASAIDARSGF
ncbi:MAG: type IV toxin-antitoxin system AbiEi family antitoxin domain-containing protein [Candidatus Nanopelagicales bacterium]